MPPPPLSLTLVLPTPRLSGFPPAPRHSSPSPQGSLLGRRGGRIRASQQKTAIQHTSAAKAVAPRMCSRGGRGLSART